jgi:hypothetical protein
MARIGRFIRTYPMLFGVLITMIVFPLAIIMVTSNSSLEQFFGNNQVWFPFAIFTATTFSVLASRFRPRREQTRYWTIVSVTFLLHLTFFILFMRHVRALAPVDYVAYGPFEWFAVGLVLYYAGRFRRSGIHSPVQNERD